MLASMESAYGGRSASDTREDDRSVGKPECERAHAIPRACWTRVLDLAIDPSHPDQIIERLGQCTRRHRAECTEEITEAPTPGSQCHQRRQRPLAPDEIVVAEPARGIHHRTAGRRDVLSERGEQVLGAQRVSVAGIGHDQVETIGGREGAFEGGTRHGQLVLQRGDATAALAPEHGHQRDDPPVVTETHEPLDFEGWRGDDIVACHGSLVTILLFDRQSPSPFPYLYPDGGNVNDSAKQGHGALGYDGGLTCAMQCADLDRAISWYTDVLGFELLYRMDAMAWAELKSAVSGVQIGLGAVEKPQTQGGATLTWGVVDIDAARARLEDEDVRFDGETQTIPEMVRLATFFDPDGNRHMLYEELTGPGAPS